MFGRDLSVALAFAGRGAAAVFIEHGDRCRGAATSTAEVAKMLGTDDGGTWLRNLASDLQIPGLATYGITEDNFQSIIDKAKRASSMKANPVDLADEELSDILRAAL